MEFNKELQFENLISSDSRVLVINPLNTYWSMQLTSEIALRAREKSLNVNWLNVAKKQKSMFEINKQDYISPLKYKHPDKILKSVLTKNGVNVMIEKFHPKERVRVPQFNNISELRQFRMDDINFGAMIFSAIASAKHTTSFSIREVKEYIDHYMKSAISMRHEIETAILELEPNLVLTINDRLIGSSLGINFAKKHKIDSFVVYWGSDVNCIEEYQTSLYDSNEWQRKIAAKWESNPPNQTSRKLLLKKVSDLATNPSSDSRQFLGSQIKGLSITKKKKTCVFYAQSEHEHSPNFISDTHDRFQNQYMAFHALQEVALEFDYDLILKFHPVKAGNKALKRNPKHVYRDWESVSVHDSVHQISPDSRIDTYALVNDADINVVWSGTVGLESIARNRRTIVLGKPHWLDLNWGIHAWTQDEIRNAFNGQKSSLTKECLVPWFWYLEEFGSKVRYAKIDKSLLNILGNEIFIPTAISKIQTKLNTIISIKGSRKYFNAI